MSQSAPILRAITAVSVTLIALSPMFGAQEVMAATATNTWSNSTPSSVSATQGQSSSFSVTSSVYGLTSTDQYQYQMSLLNNLPTPGPVPSITLDQPGMVQGSSTISGTPGGSNPSVTDVVYSVYGSQLAQSNPFTFSLTPTDVGNFTATIQLMDTTTGTAVGQPESVPMTVAPATPTIGMSLPFAQNVNAMYVTAIQPGSTPTTDPVYYHIQVTNSSNGSAVPSSAVQISWPDSSGNGTYNPLTTIDGAATVGYPNGLAWNASNPPTFGLTFSTAGEYNVYFTVMDAKTNQAVAYAAGQVYAGSPNVTGTVYGAGGQPQPNVGVNILPPTSPSTNSLNYSYDMTGTDPNGNFSTYLPPGQGYSVTQLVYGSVNGSTVIPVNPPVTFNVSATTGATIPSLTMPQTGTVDGLFTSNGTTPVTNGSVTIYPATSSGGPDMTQQPTYYTVNSAGAFSPSLPVGAYYITSAMINGQMYTIDQPFSVTANQTTSITVQPAALSWTPYNPENSGSIFSNQITLAPYSLTADPVYFQVQVTSGGNPATSGVWIANQLPSQSQPTVFNLNSSGVGTVDKSAPVSLNGVSSLTLQTQFANPGAYDVTYSIIDATTGKTVGSTTQQIDIPAANVTGTVFAADGKTSAGYVNVVFTNSSTGQNVYALTNQDGQFQTYLSPGAWTATQISDQSGATTTLTGSQQKQVTITSGGSSQSVTLTDPSLNVVGTAYIDGAKTQPLVDGYLEIQVPSSVSSSGSTTPGGSGAGDEWISTNKAGQFALNVPAGQTITVLGESTATNFISLTQSLSVGTGVNSLTVAPPAPDFDLPVNAGSGQSIAGAYVGFVTAADYASNNYANAEWFPVQNGTVSGNLPSGSYVAFGISSSSNWTPTDVAVTITSSGQEVTQPAVAPATPLVSGTLYGPGNTPLSNAFIIVAPASDPSQTVALSTDSNGNYTDLGYNVSGNYGDLLQPGTQYEVVGISNSQNDWIPLTQTFTTPAAGSTLPLNIQLPAPVQGSVSVNGKSVSQGSIAFGPASPIDQTGQSWQWAPINSGNYSAYLPHGSWIVYAIYDNATGAYYDETAAAQTPVTVNDPTSPVTDNVSLADNFQGTLVNGSTPVANAWIELSSVANPTTPAEYSAIQGVATDSSGNFSTNLAPGAWYVLGVSESNGNFIQLSQTETVGTAASTGLQINIAPNVTGTINWTTAPTAPYAAWVIVQQKSSGQIFGAPASGLNTNTWTYDLNLPSGTYNVLGIDTQPSGTNPSNQGWIDLSAVSGNTFTVPPGSGSTVNPSMSPQNYTGSVTWPQGTTAQSGFVVFQNTTTGQFASAQITSAGQFTTTFSNANGWKVVGAETASQYFTATGAFSNGSWSVTVN